MLLGNITPVPASMSRRFLAKKQQPVAAPDSVDQVTFALAKLGYGLKSAQEMASIIGVLSGVERQHRCVLDRAQYERRTR
jgi:hypothetical protein